MVEITATEQNIEKKNEKTNKQTKNEDSLRDLWDINCPNICIIEVTEGEERGRTWENI